MVRIETDEEIIAAVRSVKKPATTGDLFRKVYRDAQAMVDVDTSTINIENDNYTGHNLITQKFHAQQNVERELFGAGFEIPEEILKLESLNTARLNFTDDLVKQYNDGAGAQNSGKMLKTSDEINNEIIKNTFGEFEDIDFTKMPWYKSIPTSITASLAGEAANHPYRFILSTGVFIASFPAAAGILSAVGISGFLASNFSLGIALGTAQGAILDRISLAEENKVRRQLNIEEDSKSVEESLSESAKVAVVGTVALSAAGFAIKQGLKGIKAARGMAKQKVPDLKLHSPDVRAEAFEALNNRVHGTTHDTFSVETDLKSIAVAALEKDQEAINKIMAKESGNLIIPEGVTDVIKGEPSINSFKESSMIALPHVDPLRGKWAAAIEKGRQIKLEGALKETKDEVDYILYKTLTRLRADAASARAGLESSTATSTEALIEPLKGKIGDEYIKKIIDIAEASGETATKIKRNILALEQGDGVELGNAIGKKETPGGLFFEPQPLRRIGDPDVNDVLGIYAAISKRAPGVEGGHKPVSLSSSQRGLPYPVDRLPGRDQRTQQRIYDVVAKSLSETPISKDTWVDRTYQRAANTFGQPQYPESSRFVKDFLVQLKNDFVALDEAGIVPRMDRFSTEAISASSTGAQREAMLRHNLLLTNAQFNEITISSMAFPEGGVNKGFFTSHFAYNNVTNALNAGIELVINDTGGIIYPMLEEINTGGKALAKISGRYSGALDMVPENHVSVIADNMILGTKKDFYSTSFKKIFKDLDKYALELGIDIGYTPDYMPNNWDRAKIGLMTAEEWKNKMLPLVNEKRMLSVSKDRGMTGNISEILMSAHESLATARLSTKIVGNTTQIVPSERTIYFKDGHSWLKAHEDFGRSTSVTEAVKRSLLATQNDIIRATVGASSNQQIEGIVASLMNAINTKAREAGYKVNYKTTTKLAQNITNALSTNSGMVVDGWFSRFRKIANNVAIKSMTSGAAVTAAVMDNLGNISTLGRLWGMGTTGVFSKTAENMSKLSKPELKKLMSIANYERTCLTNHIDRYINGVNKTPIKELGQSAKRLSSSAANIPRSLTNYVAERNETRVTLAFMSAVQDQSSVPYLRLRKSFRLFLQKYGIREAEWEAYKKLPSVMVDDMTKIKSAKFLMNNGHDSVLVKKFATAEVGATLFGAPRSTLLARMKGTYSDNTVVSFMSDFITPFYNIANNGYIGMGNYLGEMLHQRQYSDFAVSFGQLLLAGYATYAAKKLLKGEKPKQDGDALMKSVLYAGIAGSAGEALIENMVMGEIVSSGVNPILQTMLRTGKGAKKGSMYSAANTLTRSANPYANFSVTGALIQKYTTNLLFAVLDPDGYAKYSDRLQQRVDEEKTTALAAWVKKPPVEPLKPSRYRGRSSSRASASSTRRRASNVRRTGRR